MPLQNRVTPFGEIVAISARGTFLGNRGGALHNHDRQIVRQYASRRWITCVLEFKGRRRIVMSQNRYTELFFLDEAVSLAAGHRPCAECRRPRYNDFKAAWLRDRAPGDQSFLSADSMDLELHRARFSAERTKVIYRASADSLPDGCFVQVAEHAYLVFQGAWLRWSPTGYVEKCASPGDRVVAVLTPEPIVRCLRNGYKPEIHYSASAL